MIHNVPWRLLRTNSDHWIGCCDSLKLTVQADTRAELLEDINLVLDALLQDLCESCELDRFLDDHGLSQP